MTAVDWDVDLVWGEEGRVQRKEDPGSSPGECMTNVQYVLFQSSWYFIIVRMTIQVKQSNAYLKRVEVRRKCVVSRIPIHSNCSWTQFLCNVCSIVAYLASVTHSSAADTKRM